MLWRTEEKRSLSYPDSGAKERRSLYYPELRGKRTAVITPNGKRTLHYPELSYREASVFQS
jgi:hypothetical protein